MLLGPDTGMSTYSGHPLVGTAGVPLVVYPGLKLNFLRPKFMRVIKDFVSIPSDCDGDCRADGSNLMSSTLSIQSG
jgi:hypothetical protein